MKLFFIRIAVKWLQKIIGDKDSVPLIYTIKGNVPVNSLAYSHEWIDSESDLRFIETYRDSTGQIVKQSPHVILKSRSAPVSMEQGKFG